MTAKSDTFQRDKQVMRYIHRTYWRAMVRHRFYFTLVALFHSPYFFLNNVFTPLMIAYGLQAILTKHFSLVPHYAVITVVASLLAGLFMGIGTWAFNHNGVAAGGEVQAEVFANYLAKDYAFFTDNFIGALGAQAAQFRQAFTEYERIFMFDVPRAAVTVIAGVAVIAYHSLPLAMITLACMALVLSFTIGTSRFRLKYRRMVSEASSHLAGVLGDALSHGPTVKSFASEDYEMNRLEGAINRWRYAQRKSWDFFTPVNGGRNILLAFTMGTLLLVSSNMYQKGTISIAIVALVQLYVVKLVNTTIDIAEIIKSYEQVIGQVYAPAATMLIPVTIAEPALPKKLKNDGALRLELAAVGYHYDEAKAGQDAVRDFSLAIKPGERIGLVGYSGSGKTTLTKLLMRFMDCTTGSITLNDVDIRDLSQKGLRQHLAYVPQEPLLFHRSIHENIAYGMPDATETQIKKAARAAYVDEFVKDLPKGYDTMVGERGIKLSGGQRQRIAIARALLKDAPILILDEATSALDSQSEVMVQEALWKLMKGRTAVVVAHRLSTIQHMDRIVVMDKGKIIQVGSHDELLKDKRGAYAKLWAHQSGGYIGVPVEEDS